MLTENYCLSIAVYVRRVQNSLTSAYALTFNNAILIYNAAQLFQSVKCIITL